VWVTAVQPTTIYVKYDGNVTSGPNTAPNGLKYDVAYVMGSFESRQIYDPDKNQTGMRVFTADSTLITGAWGEDPAKASAGTPYMDVGYTIPPLPQVVVSKGGDLWLDVGGEGEVDPGDTLAYTITVKNTGAVTLFGTVVSETLPLNTGYVTNSTYLNGSPVTDNGATRFPLDEGGINVGTLVVGNTAVITYGLKLNDFPPVYSAITNTAEVWASEGLFTVTVKTPVNTGNITACSLDFTNSGGSSVTAYLENDTVYVQVNDNDQNTDSGSAQTVQVTVQNQNTGDRETITLTETGNDTGVFRGSLPASVTGGVGVEDGVLNAVAGHTLQADFTDPVYGDSCSDTATVTAPSLTKVLYLSADGTGSPDQDLDRVDPAATGDGTTALTAALAPSAGTIAVDAISTGQREGVFSSMTVAHTTGTGQNRLMLVGISLEADNSSSITVTSVSYAGQSLTRVGLRTQDEAHSQMWRLVNPPSGAGTVTVTVSNAASEDSIVVGVATFTGVDQTTPLGTVAGSNGTSASPSINVSSATGELVLAVLAADDGRTATDAGGQTSRWNLRTETGADGIRGAGSTKAGATSTTLSWTLDVSDWWAVVAAPIKPAPSVVPSTTFTQTLAMASDFAMPAGGPITVTTYISGSLGANGTKAITATLRYNGATFATLTNGTYNSAAGTLVWSGNLGSNTTVSTGQAVSLTVTSGVTNTFQIRYDSATYPSKIQLPTNTVIDVTSLGVYDAAYPGGALLTGGANGQTVYVRITASDPFGPSDVLSSTLALAGPLGTTNVTLTSTHVVATSGATKTYEYPWATPAASGAYTVTATSYEGYEGITDSAATPFTLNFQDTGTPCSLDFVTASGVPTTTFSLGARVYLRCSDLDQNANAGVAETITVTLTTSNGDSETLTLTETGADTSIFAGDISSSNTGAPTQGNSNLEAPAGTVINAQYVDPDSPSDVCTDSAMISAVTPAMSIAKTRVEPSDGVAVMGELVRFDVIVGNPGPTMLVTATLTDTFPSSCLAYQSASLTPSSVVTPTLAWSNIGPIASGANRTISLYFVATAACDPATNSVSGSAIDQNGAAISAGPATANVVTTRPQLDIAKTLVSPPSGSAVVGDVVTFQINITNSGTTAIAVLPLQDNYSPACLTFISSSPSASGAGGGGVLWDDLGSLAVGASKVVTTVFQVAGPCAPATNLALVDNAVDVNGDRPPAVQDDATITTTAEPSQISLLKLLTAPITGTAYLGDPITYTVRITNTGPNAITSLTLTDTFNSACQAITSWGAVAPTWTGADQAVWDTLIPTEPPLLPGHALSLTFGFQALVPTAVCTNTVTAAGLDQFGQAVGPLTNQASVIVGERPQIGVAKALVGGIGSIGAGAYVVTYTLQVQNYGDVVLSSVQVTDTLSLTFPSPVIFAVNSVTASAGLTPNAAFDGAGDLNLLSGTDSLALGASGAITFSVTITPGLAGPSLYENQAWANGVGVLGTIVADASQDGGNPDPDANGNPGDNDVPTPLTLGVVYGHLFVDTDGNGAQGVGEPNLSGVSVVITDSLGVTRTVVSDASGNYTATVPSGLTFADVVEATLPAGYVQTAGSDPSSVNAPAGSVTSIGDDGYQPQATVFGHIFEDTDRNGTQDPGEPNLPNISVVITDSLGITRTVTTDASGNYTATVPAGDTTADVVESTLPVNYEQTAGSDPSTVNAPAGSTTDLGDDGYALIRVRLGGVTWLDINSDGIRQPVTETTAVVLVPIYVVGLTDTGVTVDITLTTSVTGSYVVENLLPGVYTVTAPSTWGGSLVTTPTTQTVTLNASQPERMDLDFGYGIPTAIRFADIALTAVRGAVRLAWQVTVFGDGPAPAFHVWRMAGADGPWQRLSPAAIGPAGGDGLIFSYVFADAAVERGAAYSYRLAADDMCTRPIREI
jgi:uncharacterized repeat protein (TIGR01451 family)